MEDIKHLYLTSFIFIFCQLKPINLDRILEFNLHIRKYSDKQAVI